MAVRQTQALVTLSFNIKAGLKGRCSGMAARARFTGNAAVIDSPTRCSRHLGAATTSRASSRRHPLVVQEFASS